MKLKTVVAMLAMQCLFIASSSLSNVIINEIMYRPATMNSDDEFIELRNAGTEAADLSNWSLAEGVRFAFPQGAKIAPGGFLILSPNPARFEQTYGISGALGPYDGKLDNNGETLSLVDQTNSVVERFEYSSELGWPAQADGFGATLERVHPQMPAGHRQSWSAGPNGGTPGALNQSALPMPFPIVANVGQSAAAPSSSQSVDVTCQVFSNQEGVNVALFYKPENENAFHSMAMASGAVNQRVYSGTIPPYPNNAIVEFYIAAVDGEDQAGMFPDEGADRAAVYRVYDQTRQTELPLYRIVMREGDERVLRTRDPRSDIELDGSFVFGDRIYYNVGVRFRGKGSRSHEPKNYRVNFADTEYFEGIRKLNLNIVEPDRQFIGLEAFKRLNIPAPEKYPVSLFFNDAYVPNYLVVERADRQMMSRAFGDGSGNLYRGIEQANLDYRGEDVGRYLPHYRKETNEREADYSDVIRLSDAFSNLSDEEFAAGIQEHINVAQWIRWMALKQILNDLEGGLSKERGDDYYMYHNPGDGLFYLLPWDLDSVMVEPLSAIHHHGTPAIRRLLRHPDFARFYYQQLLQILRDELTVDVMNDIIDQAAPLSSPQRLNYFRNLYPRIRQFHFDRIPQELALSVEVDGRRILTPLASSGDEWRYFRGRANPGDWTNNGYDDSQWEAGPSGFGYGDNDDRTVLSDMRNNYTTVFTRKSFDVANPRAFSQLQLRVLVDDGFVAYLNGMEIARHNVGGTPAWNSTANSAFEASERLEFNIADAESFLREGRNVLAVVGVNTNITSSDLTLDVQMDGVAIEGDSVVLRGMANAAQARWVTVNGEDANYVPWTGEWEYRSALPAGRHCVVVQALDARKQTVERLSQTVYAGVSAPQDGVELCENETWRSADNPHEIMKTIIVPKGVTLTVEPGAIAQLAPGVSIIVFGAIQVNGSETEPALFDSLTPNTDWGSLAIVDSSETNRIAHAVFTNAAGAAFRGANYPSAVSVRNSAARFEHCRFLDLANARGIHGGVDASGSVIMIRDSAFETIGEAVHANNSNTLIENCVFKNILGPNDAIDFDGQLGAPSIIRNSRFVNSENDAIDTGYTSALVEGNWIQGCKDKGISLEGNSRVDVHNNVIVDCVIGIAVKDRCEAQLIHNTIVDSATGVWVYEKNAGRGGGMAELTNSIVWASDIPALADEKSSLFVQASNLKPLASELMESNFSFDPLFVDPANLDYSLRDDSPLIDRGVPSHIQLDYAGQARPMGASPDIGAFEAAVRSSLSDWHLH